MTTSHSFYINHTEVTPANAGEISISKKLKQERGGRYFETTLSGDIKIAPKDYEVVRLAGDFEALPFEIIESTNGVKTKVFEGFVVRAQGESESRHRKNISLKAVSRNATSTFLANGDQTLNLMRVSPAVDYSYTFLNYIEYAFDWTYETQPNPVFTPSREKPYFGDFIVFANGATAGGTKQTLDQGGFVQYLSGLFYAREIAVTYNQAGEPRQPTGAGWKRLFLGNANINLTTWYRLPDIFNPAQNGVTYFDFTIADVGVPPPPLPTNNGQIWKLVGEVFNPELDEIYRGYVDLSQVTGEEINLNNGRHLFDVLQYGVNQANSDLSFASNLLTDELNPVTGNLNELEGLIIHSSEDVKNPDADPSEFTRRLDFDVITLLENFCTKFNCYWTVDDMSWQIKLEHNSTQRQNASIDVDFFFDEYPDVNYTSEDLPKFEELQTTSLNIDFSGTSIENFTEVASGKESLDASQLVTDVYELFLRPQKYSDDLLVLVQPESLEDSQNKAEVGEITDYFRPNVALGQANINEKYAAYRRRLDRVGFNFKNYRATIAPFRKLPTVYLQNVAFSDLANISFASLRFFDPLGDIESITYNLGSKIAEIEITF